MTKREQITAILDTMDPTEALQLMESIGKERRKKNGLNVINKTRDRKFAIVAKKK